MRGIAKNLYLAFTGVCALALIIFLIQLIIINSGNDNSDDLVVQDGTSTPGGPATPDTNPFDSFDPASADPGLQTPRPPSQGTMRELLVESVGTTLIIYTRDELFSYSEEELGWRFNYTGGGNASLEIGFEYLAAQNVGQDTERFLNAHIDTDNAEYKGEFQILDSHMSGYNVSAVKNGTTYEAWLYRLPNIDLALFFLISYDHSGQRDDLYEVLSSMSIEQG